MDLSIQIESYKNFAIRQSKKSQFFTCLCTSLVPAEEDLES